MKVCVIIPAYNEEQTIGGLVKELRKNNLDVLVVDDGSTDNTAEIAARCGAHLVGWKKNLGKGVAIRGGFQFAKERDYDGVVMMDGDGQHSIKDIPNFLKAANTTGADIIIGNRMNDTRLMPLLRFIVNRVTSYILFRIMGQKIPDSQCGYRFISKGALFSLRLSACKYDLESEMLIKAKKDGLRIHSIPIQTIYQGSRSYIHPLKDTARFIKLILRFRKQYGKI